jgi:hypothetical protein
MVADAVYLSGELLGQTTLAYLKRCPRELGESAPSVLSELHASVAEQVIVELAEGKGKLSERLGLADRDGRVPVVAAWPMVREGQRLLGMLCYPPPAKSLQQQITELEPAAELLPRDLSQNDPYNRRGVEYRVLQNLEDAENMGPRIRSAADSGDARRRLRTLRTREVRRVAPSRAELGPVAGGLTTRRPRCLNGKLTRPRS